MTAGHGCFGCLGCLPRLFLGLVLAAALMGAIAAVFAPWSFYLGGEFHLLPLWQGRGQLHTRGGDYVVYFWIMPTPPGRVSRAPQFRGWATVCTPKGERLSLRATAVLRGHQGADTNGQAMHVTMYARPWYYSVTGRWDHRPELEFDGRWQNPDLVMTDAGSLSRAFQPDGTVYRGPTRNQPPRGQPVPVVFHESAWWRLWTDCGTAARLPD